MSIVAFFLLSCSSSKAPLPGGVAIAKVDDAFVYFTENLLDPAEIQRQRSSLPAERYDAWLGTYRDEKKVDAVEVALFEWYRARNEARIKERIEREFPAAIAEERSSDLRRRTAYVVMIDALKKVINEKQNPDEVYDSYLVARRLEWIPSRSSWHGWVAKSRERGLDQEIARIERIIVDLSRSADPQDISSGTMTLAERLTDTGQLKVHAFQLLIEDHGDVDEDWRLVFGRMADQLRREGRFELLNPEVEKLFRERYMPAPASPQNSSPDS